MPSFNTCFEYPGDVIHEQEEAKGEVHRMKRKRSMQAADSLKQTLSVSLQHSMDLAQGKGSSIWLTSLPIQEFGFALHKWAHQDALALSYGWQPLQAFSACACGTKFSTEHALSCSKGSFHSIGHIEIRDLTANLLTEVCNDVSIEPELLTIDGEVFIGTLLSHTVGMVQDWISLLMVFGVVNSNVLSLMCDFLVLMLPLTDTPVVTESTSYFDQLFSVSGVLAPAVDTRPNFSCGQWTWSYQNLSLFSFLLLSKFVILFVYMTTSLLWVLNLYFTFA